MAVLPEASRVPDPVRNLLDKDSTDRGIPIVWPLERATGMAALYVPAAEPFGNGLQVRRNTVGERFPGVQRAQACPIVSLSR